MTLSMQRLTCAMTRLCNCPLMQLPTYATLFFSSFALKKCKYANLKIRFNVFKMILKEIKLLRRINWYIFRL